MLLREIFPDHSFDTGPAITAVTTDSRLVVPGTLFFAIRGERTDGHRFVPDAVKQGAAAVVVSEPVSAHVPVIVVPADEIRFRYAEAARKLYAPDITGLLSIGITGTNGKTSTAWILSQALAYLGRPSLYSGTLGMQLFASNGDDGLDVPLRHETSLTTPFAEEFFQVAGSAQDMGAEAAVVECASHAIAQRRIAGVAWDLCVFTNLTRDHLDYHGTLEEYGRVKSELFTRDLAESPKKEKTAVINLDDPYGASLAELVRDSDIEVWGFSRTGNQNARTRLMDAHVDLSGSRLIIRRGRGSDAEIRSKLIGDYNLENLLTAFSALAALGFADEEIADVLARVEAVPGRLERVGCERFGVFVDYAHTPDALARAQESLRQITPGRIITVFGCGGDRDRGKRPQMGLEVAKGSDIGIVTSDNPRSEDPETIVAEIIPGLEHGASGFSFEAIVERKPAIERAISLAREGDAVLIAGKGHEEYQDIGGVKHHFSDREVAAEAIRYRRGAEF